MAPNSGRAPRSQAAVDSPRGNRSTAGRGVRIPPTRTTPPLPVRGGAPFSGPLPPLAGAGRLFGVRLWGQRPLPEVVVQEQEPPGHLELVLQLQLRVVRVDVRVLLAEQPEAPLRVELPQVSQDVQGAWFRASAWRRSGSLVVGRRTRPLAPTSGGRRSSAICLGAPYAASTVSKSPAIGSPAVGPGLWACGFRSPRRYPALRRGAIRTWPAAVPDASRSARVRHGRRFDEDVTRAHLPSGAGCALPL